MYHCHSGGERERVPGECPCIVDGACGGDELHDLLPTAKRTDRKTSANDLPQGGEIRPDIVVYLCSTDSKPVSRDYFIEYQEYVMGFRDLTNSFKVSAIGEDRTDISHHGLKDKCSHILAL
ncbi:MAG: hypothetical protein A4E42_02002 [Methanoregulaceae archaeon PtaU1.Bin222]|nr:MAG: hypothetical protein A4E42_02002 [Methanoregulaceae archaeon PtaU1.Bin222]